MNIIDISKDIEEVIIKNDLTELATSLKVEYAISKSSELEKAINLVADDGRVLKIGIVGRVKAGKSSLLNALVFDGKDILPKAATPMTAALTILEYGDETKAEVDFFTKEDIDEIKRESENYKLQLENLTKQKYKELSEIKIKKQKKLTPEQEKEIESKAQNRANKEMKQNDKLFSSFDQYNKIQESNLSLDDLKEFSTIKADNIGELNQNLLEFVGAKGRYMPFTKSVTLQLQEDSLRDIQIIDTPGVNDPVTSREDRTKELLKFCDVVLVVSPSGQFLSSEDIDLMDKITTKEGIKEIYIVASQVDNQLFGSEKAKGNAIFSKVLSIIEDNLTKLQSSVLSQQKEQFPEIGNTFDSLIENRVVLSSGIAYSMMKNFDSQSTWDENTQTVWGNLKKHYQDFFSDKDTALANLEKLANISKIQDIIHQVRMKKNEILKKRKDEFIATKTKAILDYKNAIEKDIKESIKRIENTNIDELKKQKNELLNLQDKVSIVVNEEYFDLVDSLDIEIKNTLNNKVKSYFKESKRDIKESESDETETWTTKEGGLFGFFQDTVNHSRTFTTVKAGSVRNSLENLTSEIEDTVEQDSKKYILNWKKSLNKTLIASLRREAGDDLLDVYLISKTLRGILNSVKYPEINYNGIFPNSLKKSGTLKERDAEDFLEEAGDYVSDLKSRVKNDIKNYVGSLSYTLKEQDIASSLFGGYSKDIEKLENEIENKELTLDRYDSILKRLGDIDA